MESWFYVFSETSGPALGPTQPPIQWAPRALSMGVKRPGREGHHSSLSSVEDKHEWGCSYVTIFIVCTGKALPLASVPCVCVRVCVCANTVAVSLYLRVFNSIAWQQRSSFTTVHRTVHRYS